MITMTDLFCGAGGSSTGALAVPGVTVRRGALVPSHRRIPIQPAVDRA